MNRTRSKQILIRVSEKEYQQIKKKVARSKLNQNEYLLKACLNKNITVIPGMTNVTMELKRIGNNLNQLTKACHEGKADCRSEVEEIEKELGEVWQLLRQLIQGQA